MTALILTAAGNSLSNESKSPLLIEFEGNEFIVNVIASYFPIMNEISIVIRKSDHASNELEDVIRSKFNGINIYQTLDNTRGSLCSALLGLGEISEDLLVASGDAYIDGNIATHIEYFKKTNCDAGLIVFKGNGDKWSFTRITDENRVIEIAEKQRISPYTTTGIFWFASRAKFLEAAEFSLVNRFEHKGHFFSSSAIQAILSKNGLVLQTEIQSSDRYLFMNYDGIPRVERSDGNI